MKVYSNDEKINKVLSLLKEINGFDDNFLFSEYTKKLSSSIIYWSNDDKINFNRNNLML